VLVPQPSSAPTKARIVDAALQTLKTKGFPGASAREIANAGGFNQALLFYHFGSVHNALLAALDLVSERRMEAYRPAFEQSRTIPELATLAREIYAEDLQNGYVTVLAAMVAGGASDPELGAAVVARLEPWIDLVQGKLRELLRGSLLEPLVPARDAAFAIIALYLGIDLMSHLEGDHSRAQALLELGIRYAPLAGMLIPGAQQGDGSG
jgi:AcrR family transcriptional regulator